MKDNLHFISEAAGSGGKANGKEVADIEVSSSSIVQGATIGEVVSIPSLFITNEVAW